MEQQTDIPSKNEERTTQPAPITTPAAPPGFFLGMTILVSFMTTLMTGLLLLTGYDHFIAKKFMVVDVKGFIDQQQTLYLAGKINDAQLNQSFEALKNAVAKIPKNRIVFMGDAVLGGAEKLDLSSLEQP